MCFWYHTSAKWAATSASMMPGTIRMCRAYILGTITVPGNSPPNSAQCAQVPMTGTDSVMPESVARIPVPDSRSSGSE